MMTQRECDIALLEMKMVVNDLFEEWRKSYMGRRAERMMQNGQGEPGDRQVQATQYGGGAVAPGQATADTGSNAAGNVYAAGGPSPAMD